MNPQQPTQPGQYHPQAGPPQGPPQFQYQGPPPGFIPQQQPFVPEGYELTKKRSWFRRHKIMTAFLIIIGLMVVGSLMPGGDSGTTATTSDQAQDEPAAPVAKKPAKHAAKPVTKKPAPAPQPKAPAVPGVGDPVRDGKFSFTVTKIERKKTIGDEWTEETAQGEYVIVWVNVSNIGDEAQMMMASEQILHDTQGREFETSDDALFAMDEASEAIFEDINPGNSIKDAALVFDVPKGTKLDKLELHDSMFSGGVDVSLK